MEVFYDSDHPTVYVHQRNPAAQVAPAGVDASQVCGCLVWTHSFFSWTHPLCFSWTHRFFGMFLGTKERLHLSQQPVLLGCLPVRLACPCLQRQMSGVLVL